jgi:hypothetical protein
MTGASERDTALFGRTNFRDDRRIFGIRENDRMAHLYVVGKTGTGKSTLLETLIVQDLRAGRGLTLLDPHGDLVERVLREVPHERQADLIYFDAADPDQPVGFNPLLAIAPARRPLVAGAIVDALRGIWADSWGPRMEHILRYALLTALEGPSPTIEQVLWLLSDWRYRRDAIERLADPELRSFWLLEFEQYPDRLRAEVIAPIQNKLGAFLAHPVLRRILQGGERPLDLRGLMDAGGILLVNLAKGRMGGDATALLGALLVASLGEAGLERADTPLQTRRPFFLYLDEFHTFATKNLALMLGELRKYRVGLILAHQHLSQLDDEVRDAILGNVGTIVSFRVGPEDAEILAQEFQPAFGVRDLVGLPRYQIYLRLMVDGEASRPFSAETITVSDLSKRSSGGPDGP